MKTKINEKIHLYYYPGTRADRVRWVLEELNLSYDLHLVDLPQGAHKRDEYLAIHPLGKVPAIKIGDEILFESLAICLYLADQYGSINSQTTLAPKYSSPDRSEYYQWMALSMATLEPAIIEEIRIKKAQESGVESIDMGPALTPFKNVISYINEALTKQKYLLGEYFSCADLLIASLLMWADSMKLLTNYPQTRVWIKRIKQRPAYLAAQT